jgi:hypothetical protein
MPLRCHPALAACSSVRQASTTPHDILCRATKEHESRSPGTHADMHWNSVTTRTMSCWVGDGGVTTSSAAGAAFGSPHTGGGIAAQRAASGDNAIVRCVAIAAGDIATPSAASAAVGAGSNSSLWCISLGPSNNSGTSAAAVVRDTCDVSFPPVLAAWTEHQQNTVTAQRG